MRYAQSASTVGGPARRFGCCGSKTCCSSWRDGRRPKISIKAASIGVGLAPGEEFCDCSKQFGKWARIPWLIGPPGIRFNEYVDSGNHGKDVEDVDVVVASFGPHMSEVQKLKREICSVGRESGGDNEISHEASAFFAYWSSVGQKEVAVSGYTTSRLLAQG